MVKLFVYGSLRQGMYNYERYLKGNSTYLGTGYVKGALYTLKGKAYPALIEGEDFIPGEIYEVEETIAQAVDALEEYVPGNKDNEYQKVKRTIYDAKQEVLTNLDVYMFNMEKPGHKELLDKRIKDFVKHTKEQ